MKASGIVLQNCGPIVPSTPNPIWKAALRSRCRRRISATSIEATSLRRYSGSTVSQLLIVASRSTPRTLSLNGSAKSVPTSRVPS